MNFRGYTCFTNILDLVYKFKLPEVQIMVEKSNQHVVFIQIDASSYAEFEISEFEISKVDCI